VVLIDRTNPPRVSTFALPGGDLGAYAQSDLRRPIRGIFRNQKNTIVIMGEVTGVDKDQKCVFVSDADRQKRANHL